MRRALASRSTRKRRRNTLSPKTAASSSRPLNGIQKKIGTDCGHRKIVRRHQMTEPTLGNNTVIQVGIIVRDIETKARAWSEILGLPMPNVIITDTMDKTQAEYNGELTPARAKLAFFHMGQLDVELIEPIDAPS